MELLSKLQSRERPKRQRWSPTSKRMIQIYSKLSDLKRPRHKRMQKRKNEKKRRKSKSWRRRSLRVRALMRKCNQS